MGLTKSEREFLNGFLCCIGWLLMTLFVIWISN